MDTRRWNGREWVEPTRKLYINAQGHLLEMDEADAIKSGFDEADGLGPARGVINAVTLSLIVAVLAYALIVLG